jgi:pyruvate,water dikinase
MTTQEREAFDQALASCQHANFAWWNDDHNWYVDMRCTIPIRKAAQAIARAVDFADPEDVNFLFYSELRTLATGKQSRKSFDSLIAERKAYFDEWNKRIEEMPIVLGTPPETIADPVVIEIFGITNEFLDRMKTGAGNTRQLSGVPASSGTARGVARVLRSPDELPRLRQGDVLVCVGTTPTWTPAFTKIAACVCDGGGTLTHASVVSREYRVPCVVGTGLATQIIKDGDEVTVDGDKGLVTIHRAA